MSITLAYLWVLELSIRTKNLFDSKVLKHTLCLTNFFVWWKIYDKKIENALHSRTKEWKVWKQKISKKKIKSFQNSYKICSEICSKKYYDILEVLLDVLKLLLDILEVL